MEEKETPFHITSLQICAETIKAVRSALEEVKKPNAEIATYAAAIEQSAEFLLAWWESNPKITSKQKDSVVKWCMTELNRLLLFLKELSINHQKNMPLSLSLFLHDAHREICDRNEILRRMSILNQAVAPYLLSPPIQ